MGYNIRGGYYEKWYQALLERNKERNEESRREGSTPKEDIIDELGDDISEDMSWSKDTSWSDDSSAGPSLAWPLVFETTKTTEPTTNKSEYLHNKGEENHPNPTFSPLNNDNERLYLRGTSGSREVESDVLVSDHLEDKESSNIKGFEYQAIQPPLSTLGTTILDYPPTYDHSTNKYIFKMGKEREASHREQSKSSPRPTINTNTEDDTSLAVVSTGSYDTTNISLDGVIATGRLQQPLTVDILEVSLEVVREQTCFTLRRKKKKKRQQSRLYVRLQELGLEVVNDKSNKPEGTTNERGKIHWEMEKAPFTTKVDIARIVGALAVRKLDEITCHFRKRGL